MSAREFGDELLTRLLTYAMEAIPGAVGVGLSLADRTDRTDRTDRADRADRGHRSDRGDRSLDGAVPRSVAAVGVAADLDAAQWSQATGPAWEALRSPSIVRRPSGESRDGSTAAGATLPQRALAAVTHSGDAVRHSGGGSSTVAGDGGREPPPGGPDLSGRRLLDLGGASPVTDGLAVEVRGAVFSTGEWGGELPVVVSLYLDREPDSATVQELDRHEPVLTHALAVVEYCAGEEVLAEQMIQMTQYRRVIEQAKGLIMGATGSDSKAAFETLSRASQHFNVRLRHLAVALVEHVGGAEAEHPDDPELVVHPGENDREVARQVWAALSSDPAVATAPTGTGVARP